LLFFCCFFFTGSCILGFYQVFGFVVWFLWVFGNLKLFLSLNYFWIWFFLIWTFLKSEHFSSLNIFKSKLLKSLNNFQIQIIFQFEQFF
jgi:hypothetical protein